MGSEAKFKKGDRVRFVENYGNATVGSEGVITGLWSEGVMVDVNGEDHSCYSSRVELVPPFEVGDRVRMTKSVDGHKSDDLATIIYNDGNANYYPFLIEFDSKFELGHEGGLRAGKKGKDGHCWWVGADDIELIKPLTIEAGKFYMTRDGRRVGPMRDWWGNFIENEGDARLWNTSGAYIGRVGKDSGLISEAPAITANAAAEVDNLADEYGGGKKAAASEPKFKVGDRVARPGGHADGVIKSIDGNKANIDYGSHWGMRTFDLGEIDFFPPRASPHAIVAVIEDGQPRPSTRPYVHADRTAAKAEAERLAGINKGKTFGVYELVDEAKVERVYEHEWQRLAMNNQKVCAIKSLRALTGLGLKEAKDAVFAWCEREAA